MLFFICVKASLWVWVFIWLRFSPPFPLIFLQTDILTLMHPLLIHYYPPWHIPLTHTHIIHLWLPVPRSFSVAMATWRGLMPIWTNKRVSWKRKSRHFKLWRRRAERRRPCFSLRSASWRSNFRKTRPSWKRHSTRQKRWSIILVLKKRKEAAILLPPFIVKNKPGHFSLDRGQKLQV